MKEWNNAELVELDINETANGVFNWDWESPLNLLSKSSAPESAS